MSRVKGTGHCAGLRTRGKFAMTSLWVLILYKYVLSAVCSSTGILKLCCNSAGSVGHLLRYTSESDLFSCTGVGKLNSPFWLLRCELEGIQEQVGQPLLLSIWLVAQHCVTWWAAGKTDRSTVTRTPCIQYNRWQAVSAASMLFSKLTAGSKSPVEEPAIPQPVRNSPHYVESEGSVPCSQQPSIWLYPNPDRPSPVFCLSPRVSLQEELHSSGYVEVLQMACLNYTQVYFICLFYYYYYYYLFIYVYCCCII